MTTEKSHDELSNEKLRERQKRLISALLLTVTAGDISTRINYTDLLISRIEDYLKTQIIVRDPNFNYIQRFISGLDDLVRDSIARQKDPNQPVSTRHVQDAISNVVINPKCIINQIDDTWKNPAALDSLQARQDFVRLGDARSYYDDATKKVLCVRPDLGGAMISMNRSISEIMDIADRWDLVNFDEMEWAGKAGESMSLTINSPGVEQ